MPVTDSAVQAAMDALIASFRIWDEDGYFFPDDSGVDVWALDGHVNLRDAVRQALEAAQDKP